MKKKLYKRIGNALLFMIVVPIALPFALPYLYIKKIVELTQGK